MPAPAALSEKQARGFTRAAASLDGWSLTHRKGGDYGYDAGILDITQNGRVVASIERGPTDGYGHFAYMFAPGGQTIISTGANGRIYAHGLDGKTIGEFKRP